MREYYDARAPEYDDWYLDRGRLSERTRPGWAAAVSALQSAIGALAPGRTLDLACGTGFLTRHLPGAVTGLDQSASMLSVARRRVGGAELIVGDALEPPFGADAFARVFTGHFYGHLEGSDRERFLINARALAPELVVVDAARRPDHAAQEHQRRVLNDGRDFEVFKRYFDPDELVAELGGGTVLHASEWFVMVSSPRPPG